MVQNEICEAMGYLANPLTKIIYDVQVPPKKRTEFESDYLDLTGIPPCSPGSGGYSVLGANVDKRAVQYRISYSPVGSIPSYLQSISRSGYSGRKRVSNKDLLLKMFESGFTLGSSPSRNRIIARIDSSCFIHFEFGYASALSHQETLKLDEFSGGFSAVDSTPQGEFLLHDETATKLVHSARIGRSAAFRHHILQAYDNQCCVCAGSLIDLSGVYETEAAHIVPKSLSGSDDIRNGLALCRKHHWAFDRGMFGVSGDYHVVVPNEISVIPENVSLAEYNGLLITCPDQSDFAPHHSALAWHREYVFSRSC